MVMAMAMVDGNDMYGILYLSLGRGRGGVGGGEGEEAVSNGSSILVLFPKGGPDVPRKEVGWGGGGGGIRGISYLLSPKGHKPIG